MPAIAVTLGRIGVISPTCFLEAGSRNIAVDFGRAISTTFTGVGSISANRDFDIRMDCHAGSAAQHQSRISIRLDADQDGSNMRGVLKPEPTPNSASGIGIQLVQRDGSGEREVRFGSSISVGETNAGSSPLTLPLRARYVQTQPGPVRAGAAGGAGDLHH